MMLVVLLKFMSTLASTSISKGRRFSPSYVGE